MTWKELEERVRELDVFDNTGGREPMLSKPVLYRMEDNWYVVYMLYDFYYEDVPDGFCFVDLQSGDAEYLDEHDGRVFLGISDGVYMAPAPEGHIPEYVKEEELETLFNEAIAGGTPDFGRYIKYLYRVMDSAKAEGVNFYGYFM